MKFRTKLILAFTFFFVLLSAVFFLFNLQSKKILAEESRHNRQNIAKIIQVSAVRLLTGGLQDPGLLERFIREIMNNENVTEVTVIDTAYRVLASSDPDLKGRHQPFSSMRPLVLEKDEDDTTGEYNAFEITVPLQRGKTRLGFVRTTLTLKDVGYPLEILYYKNLVITFLVLVVCFGLFALFLYRLNKPIRDLSKAAERISLGDLSAAIPGAGTDEVGRLASSFNTMVDRLSEQKRMENKMHVLERRAIVAELASNLAHEIRNPLNLISLTANYLGMQFPLKDETQKPKFNELIASIKSEVKHLSQLMTDFLSLGRPAALNKTRFSLAALTEQVQVLLKGQLIVKKANVHLSENCREEIYADPEQIRLVFLNLMLNAVEAVPSGGNLWLDLKPDPAKSASVITFEDDGPGIPDGKFEEIFEPYYTEKSSGIGLGLALVRRIIEEHGGEIAASNRSAGGARFSIVLPVKESGHD